MRIKKHWLGGFRLRYSSLYPFTCGGFGLTYSCLYPFMSGGFGFVYQLLSGWFGWLTLEFSSLTIENCEAFLCLCLLIFAIFHESSHFITDIRNNFMNLLLWVLSLFLSISFILWFPPELLTRSRWGHLPVNRFVDSWRQQMKKVFPFLQIWIHKLWKMTHFFNIR